MKKFIYTRLHSADQDYDLYIAPTYKIGALRKAIASDMISAKLKLLFLESHEGNVTFGVREELDLRDVGGRAICNFTGYQLDEGQSLRAIPFIDAFQRQFDAITAEAFDAHRALDKSTANGGSLQATAVSFSPGPQKSENDWDEAVNQILANPDESCLLMFDREGNSLPLPSNVRSLQAMTRDTFERANTPVSVPTSSFAGIRSTVTLDNSERTILPGLDHGAHERNDRRLFGPIREIFNTINPFGHRPRSPRPRDVPNRHQLKGPTNEPE